MSETSIVLVLTGPSGAGKSSIIQRVLDCEPSLTFSVSHTTRPARSNEQEGLDYYFVPQARFEAMRGGGGFLEWASVHGHLYGTALTEVERARRERKDLLLDIDVQGAAQVTARLPDSVSVFLLPPDHASLTARLRGRRSESEADISSRLATAAGEVARFGEFGYLVVNESVPVAADQVRAILAAERLRTPRRRALAGRILATFPAVEPGAGHPGGRGQEVAGPRSSQEPGDARSQRGRGGRKPPGGGKLSGGEG